MGGMACTEPQCLYKGALYFTVELYLYSPYGRYSLYRASVPVQGCTLPYSIAIPLLPLWAVRPVQSLSACTRVTFTFTLKQATISFNTFFPLHVTVYNLLRKSSVIKLIQAFYFAHGSTAIVCLGIHIVGASHSPSIDTPQSVRIPLTSDRPVAETST